MSQTAAFQTQTEEDIYQPFALVRMDLAGGTVRLFSGVGDLSWNSQTWTGAGKLGFIGTMRSGTSLRAGYVDIGLSGLDSSLKSEILNALSRGAATYIYLGFFTGVDTIVADPWLAYYGNLDTSDIDDGADGLRIKTRIIDGVGARLRRTVHRRTDADQQEIYSGDKVFEFVASLRFPEPWGAPGASKSTNPTGGSGGQGTGRGPNNGASGNGLRDY